MDAAPTFPTPSTTVHLQYVGEHHALTVGELTVGCVTVWNHGALYVVRKIESLTKCFVNVELCKVEYDHATKRYVVADDAWVRKMKLTRTIGYSPKATRALAEAAA